MKKLLVPVLLFMLIISSLPVMGAEEDGEEENKTLTNEILRLDKEDIQNQQNGNIVTFKMMNTERAVKQVEIDDTALEYMSEKDIKLTIETNILTLTITPEAFKNKDWLEAVKSGEPLAIRLLIKKGSGTKVSEYFDEWYYNQIGLSRFGTASWDVAGEILVGGVKKYTVNSFAAPINISVQYSVNASSNIGGENNLGMYVLNEAKEQWDYQGGSVDQGNRTINFNTQVPGLYIILANQKSPQFSDINGHWAEGDIQFLLANKVLEVKGDKKFYPNQEITRAEFAGFLARLLKVTAEGAANPFKDVPSNHPYYNEIVSAAKAGLVLGVSSDSFAPNQKITREQMAVMMNRALEYRKVEVKENEDALNKFNDADKISQWAKKGVSIVSSMGLMNGKEMSSFAPKSFTTKGEAAAILHRLNNITK